ncbi:MAG: lactate racemase domain-containing protein, partial [Planctomycetota bacterium]|nr:lactate racemase domain-containing protein [Planctomycetota bacterium]
LRQKFDTAHVPDVGAAVHAELGRLRLDERVAAGQSVAITAGSRGLTNNSRIIAAIVASIKGIGAEPFIVPAMGSHGGATSEGQRRLIESFGITEDSVACPIRSSMETVVVCRTAQGIPVHFDRAAFEADHVLVFNRVKPHTMFAGDIQSGLMKMMLIGLGKHEGAIVYHRAIREHGFAEIVRSVAGEVFAKCNILAGLAVVENSLDQTAVVAAVLPDEFEDRERELLAIATRLMPRLPFDEADVLLVNRIGKEISGTGMDTNVIGRKFNDHAAVEGERPRVRRIAVRNLSEATHGNGVGIGIAEFCRSRVIRATDFETTRINAATAGHESAAEQPPHKESDREVLQAAFASLSPLDPSKSKLLWIEDTKHLEELQCSRAYLPQVEARDDIEVVGDLRELPFDIEGNLPD